jgi:uncharacterized protein
VAGLAIELLVSALLLWLFDRSSLLVLGIKPTGQRILLFLAGFGVSAACCAAYYLIPAVMMDHPLLLNPLVSAHSILKSSWWTLRSVLFEEMLFRGALLYLAILKLGALRAVVLSAIFFGAYHWFSYNLFGNWAAMAVTFFMTGLTGLTYAYGFAKTKSVYLPVGLHFGWNLLNIVVFSHGPLGRQLFVEPAHTKLEGIPSLLVFLFQILAVPIIVFGSLRRYREPGDATLAQG